MSLIEQLRDPATIRADAWTVCQSAATQLEAMQAEIDQRDKRLQAVRDVIEGGYVGVAKVDQCQHGRFGFEDCVACYDEALLAALDGRASLDRQGK